MIATFWQNLVAQVCDAPFLFQTFNTIFGAALGASFYILLNTQEYLVKRSFDPKYNSVYAARFITGLIGGVILANALGPMLKGQLENTKLGFTPGILAILGGYAAEAVQQILQRLVEIMLAAVRGDGSSAATAKAQAAVNTRDQRVRQLLIDHGQEQDPAKKKAIMDQIQHILATPVNS
jgi:hypothetical protein